MLQANEKMEVVEAVLADLSVLVAFYNEQLQEDAESAAMYMEDIMHVNRTVLEFIDTENLDTLEQELAEQDTFVRDHFASSFEVIREIMEIDQRVIMP